jgi:hypothetical protein
VPLSSVWKDMWDAMRQMVLRMVVDILLELASYGFDKIGTIFQRESDNATKQNWYVVPMVSSPNDTSVSNAISNRTFTSAVDYWLAHANASIRDTNFGQNTKICEYSSCAPSSLICTTPPSTPLVSPFVLEIFQNIMMVDGETSPRIAAIIDWEFSSPGATSTFAQYPLFIADHPLWEDDNPLRKRNVRDQEQRLMCLCKRLR